MIKIENLNKVYYSKNKIESKALNGITISLPAKGLIFILGKSGSGKSTLLNALGTLDGITSGNIKIGDKDYSSFKEKDLNNFRNSEIGFIFQDCNLIEEFTVFDNIALSMDLKNIKNKEKLIKDVLKSVDLENVEKKYPRELSGGQRQRIALCRTLVKKPSIVLADEPTGNVDSETGKKIISLLKDYAKENLVIVVSHNSEDALNYADRVIEIEDGKVIKDYIPSKSSEIVVSNNNVIIPLYRRLTEEDIEVLNNNSGENVKYFGRKYRNVNNSKVEKNEAKLEIRKNHINIFNRFRYANKIYKTRVKYSILLVFLSTIMLVLTGLLQSFAEYDPNTNIKEQLTDSEIMISTIPNYDWSRVGNLYYVSDEQKNEVISISNGKVYESYNISFIFGDYHRNSQFRELQLAAPQANHMSISDYYVTRSNALTFVDEEFLKSRYDGITVIKGDIYDKNSGVIITDYLADSMIAHIPTLQSYDDILQDTYFNAYSPKVAAIIKTDYKEKYKSILDNPTLDRKSREFLDFSSECLTKYSTLYTIDDDYMTHFFNTFTFSKKDGYRNSILYQSNGGEHTYFSFGKICNAEVKDENLKVNDTTIYHGVTAKIENEDECLVSHGFLNLMFGTKYETYQEVGKDINNFIGKKVTLTDNESFNGSNTVYEYTIKGILPTKGTSSFVVTSYKSLRSVSKHAYFRSSLLIEKSNNLFDVLNSLSKENLMQISLNSGFSIKLYDYIIVFQDVFKVLYIIIILGVFTLFIFDGFNSIKKNRYNIGVMRCLGIRNKDIVIMFLLNSLYNTLIIGVLYIIGNANLSYLINDILVKAMSKVVKAALNESFTIIQFSMKQAIINVTLIYLMTFISVIIQTLTIKKIKPIEIVRRK